MMKKIGVCNLDGLRWLSLAGLLILLTSCSQQPEDTPKTHEKKDPHTITFVTINSPNTYYVNERNEYAGLEYELAKRYVSSLGPEFQAKFITVDNFSKVLPMLESGQADIAAADITITKSRSERVQFSIPFHDVQQVLIYNVEHTNAPKSMNDLEGRIITVSAGTSFVERLRSMKSAYPKMLWKAVENMDSEQLIEALANGDIAYTIVDDHLFSMMQNYYPNLRKAFVIGSPEKIAWALPRNAKPEKLANINAFFTRIIQDGTLRNLIDRYHGNTARLKPLDITTFLSRMQSRLPPLVRYFKNAQDITDIDWRLLAAISYQESHWDTYNTSPTNVRGLMMLTEGTADMMQVEDRLDPKQSVPAGAKFFLWLKDRLPARIPEPDITFMTLAAYNVGVAHVEDARVLAQRLKLNPDSWADVKKTLPMLSRPEHYANAKYGYCSCGSAVIYTESVRSYYQILQRYQPSYNPDNDPFKIALR